MGGPDDPGPVRLIVESVGRLPALLVVIARPDALPLWAGHLRVTALTLSRLSGRQVEN